MDRGKRKEILEHYDKIEKGDGTIKELMPKQLKVGI